MFVQPTITRTRSELGRWMLMTDEKTITDKNVEQIIGTKYLEHQHNVQDELFLVNYERGRQPILDREKPIRPDINNRIVENNATKIVDVHNNYCFSRPITLVQRAKIELDSYGQVKSKDDGDKDDMKIGILNKMNQEQKKSSKDYKLGHDIFTTGVGYMMVYPNRKKYEFAPFEIMLLNPMTTFVIYSNDAYRDPVLAATYFIHDDGTTSFTAYTDKVVYEIESGDGGTIIKSKSPNAIGKIPIIEFSTHDRMAVFEKAIPIMDAINLINSDRINDISQHVQSLLWLHNCEIDNEQKQQLVDGDGVIMTKSNEGGTDAKITYLSQTLNQSEVQTLIDYYHQQILEMTSTPSWQEASGGSTTGAMQLSNGWQSLEISANAMEQSFIESEMRLLEVELAIIKNDPRDYGDLEKLEVSDIEVKFCRSKNYDLVSKVNSLATLINTGVDGLTAFETVNLFTDCQQAWLDSKDIIEKLQKMLVTANQQSNSRNNDAMASKDEEGNGGANNDEKTKADESVQPSKVAQVED